ncbi:ATP-grasp peptide maturase system methyltransferase [Spongiactinospora sp. 9N601]|uniref:ATP-grasp peptide maturase system methyltransferase n=1 Tax=Spongiactinospora sp. 9N601 TaxID=3375149 RepID=UPI00379B76ED
MTSDAVVLRRQLAARVFDDEELRGSSWRPAVEAVAREVFVGDAVYLKETGDGGTVWNPVHRQRTSGESWLRMVYQDETWITQVSGIAAVDAPGGVTGPPTSSSTMPSLVVKMLEVAGIGDGEKVLEVGTGTGYSTALMCERLGEELITSVEYDPQVAARARAALETAGYAPTLVIGDGLVGYEKNAEYDRLIATCSVRYIPFLWMWQVRDGGTITAPLSGWMGGSALAHLTLADDGTASGHFDSHDVAFMAARPHLPPPRPTVLHLGRGEERRCRIDPNLLTGSTGRFVAQLGAPSADLISDGDEVLLLDVATGSQATTEPAGNGWTVRQHGPLRLWDAVEEAVEVWLSAGSPHQSGFGLTVGRTGQRVWLGDLDGPSWWLPA